MKRFSILIILCSLVVTLVSLTFWAFIAYAGDPPGQQTGKEMSLSQQPEVQASIDGVVNLIASTLTLTPEYTISLPLVSKPLPDPSAVDLAYTSCHEIREFGCADSWIYLMDTVGGKAWPLTQGEGASWSPDGQTLAYSVETEPYLRDIYLINVDGTGQRALITGDADDAGPVWSPDGQRILYLSNDASDGRELYSVNADGSDLMLLAEDINPYKHAWSPDGTKILFNKSDGSAEIYVMNADGSGQVNLTNSPNNVLDWHAEWSPDGKHIVFSSNMNFQTLYTEEIFVMNADGSELKQLTNIQSAGVAWYPSWLPDGKSIAYSDLRAGVFDIYLVASDGSSAPTPFVTSSGSDVLHGWSEDDQRAVLTSDRDGDIEIYVVSSNGSGLMKLTDNDIDDYGPMWRP